MQNEGSNEGAVATGQKNGSRAVRNSHGGIRRDLTTPIRTRSSLARFARHRQAKERHGRHALPPVILARGVCIKPFHCRLVAPPFWKEPPVDSADVQLRVCSALDEIAGVAQTAQLDW